MNIKKLVALFSAIALISLTMSFPVFAKNMDNHVFNALNNKGDALIFPMYLTADGIKTNLIVINSSSDDAAVAKVVVRSHAFSTELLDFFIYLSPNDVWKGELRYANGTVVMYSEDPSVWNPSTSECASATDPFEYPLHSVVCTDLDATSIGYVEVFEAAAFNWQEIRNPNKEHCANIRDAFAVLPAGQIRTEDCLTGYGEYVFPGDYAVFPATILANNNINAKLDTSYETFLGDQAENSIGEVEAALAKDQLVLPYYNGTADISVASLTFPTKYTRVNADCEVTGWRSPFFADNGVVATLTLSDGSVFDELLAVKYNYDAYDLNEKAISECQVSPCIKGKLLLWELNLLTPDMLDIDFDAGWIRLSFDTTTVASDKDGNDIIYSGAPVIGMVAHLTENGLSLGDIAYDYGVVDGETTGAYQKGCADVVCPACDSCCPPCPDQCDADHPDLCLCEAACVDAGLNWCDNACQAEECATCDADHLNLCDTQDACEGADGHWCDEACQAEECGAATCGPEHCDLCENDTACLAAGCHWCDGACQAGACGGLPSCDADHLHLCSDQPACEGADGHWCDEACQADPCGTGPSTIIGGKTVTCSTTCIGNWSPANPTYVEQCQDWKDANCGN